MQLDFDHVCIMRECLKYSVAFITLPLVFEPLAKVSNSQFVDR